MLCNDITSNDNYIINKVRCNEVKRVCIMFTDEVIIQTAVMKY